MGGGIAILTQRGAFVFPRYFIAGVDLGQLFHSRSWNYLSIIYQPRSVRSGRSLSYRLLTLVLHPVSLHRPIAAMGAELLIQFIPLIRFATRGGTRAASHNHHLYPARHLRSLLYASFPRFALSDASGSCAIDSRRCIKPRGKEERRRKRQRG